MFGVGDVADARSAPTDAVADCISGMVQCGRSHMKPRVQLQILTGGEIPEFDLRTKFRCHVGHQWRLPTAEQRGGDAVRRGEVAAPETNARVWIEHRREERQPADMVEMCMAEQNIRLHRYGRFGPLAAKFAQSAAGIEDQAMRATVQLDTESVAAISDSCRARRGQAAADTPEPQVHIAGLLRCAPIRIVGCHQACLSRCVLYHDIPDFHAADSRNSVWRSNSAS